MHTHHRCPGFFFLLPRENGRILAGRSDRGPDKGRQKLKSATRMSQIGKSTENPSIQTISFRYPIKCPGIAKGGAYLRHTRVSRANSPGFVCYSGAKAALWERSWLVFDQKSGHRRQNRWILEALPKAPHSHRCNTRTPASWPVKLGYIMDWHLIERVMSIITADLNWF